MVNRHGDSDTDAQHNRARVRPSLLSQTETTHNMTAEQSAAPSHPPQPHTPRSAEPLPIEKNASNAPLTYTEPRGALPRFWNSLLPTAERKQTKRMWTRADGSCAKGAILLATETPDTHEREHYGDPEKDQLLAPTQSVTHPPALVHSLTAIHAFGIQIKDKVDEWTEEDWCEIMNTALRDDVWDGRPRCTESEQCKRGNCVCPYAERSPELELQLFRQGLAHAFSHQGPAFFFVAAHVINMGILLITDDNRIRGHPDRLLQDFGTNDYPVSMVIYCAIHAKCSTGHYEAVGVFPLLEGTQNVNEAAEPLTLFEKQHWLLAHLRAGAERNSVPETLEAMRVRIHRYGIVSESIRARFSASGQFDPGPELGQSSPLDPDAQRAEAHTSTRPRRRTHRPVRYEQGDDVVEPTRRRPTQRSLLPQLDGVAANAGAPPRSSSVTGRTAHANDNLQSSSVPATAASRHPHSAGLGAMSMRVLANTQAWIRSNTRSRGRMVSRVHSTFVPSWTNQCRSVLQQLVTALQKSPMNEAEVVGHICVLWLLPASVFSVPGRARGGQRGRRHRRNRIHHALYDRELIARLFASVMQSQDSVQDRSMEVSQSSVAGNADNHRNMVIRDHSISDTDCCEPNSDPANSFNDNTLEHDQSDSQSLSQSGKLSESARASQRVEAHLRAGHLKRALTCLTSTSTKADTRLASERDLLRHLHPSCPSVLPLCPVDAPEMVVDLAWMGSEMAASDTGAAPGPSGWGSNMLAVLAADPHCVTALALVIQFIVNDNMPPAARTLLTSAFLVSLVKDDQGGRRPVAVGEMLYRLAARFATFRVLEIAQHNLRPHQYGVGVQDGCTQVVQSLQHLLTQPPTPPPPPPAARHLFAFSRPRPPPPPVDSTPRPLACLSIDIANAFNTINRAAVMKAVFDDRDLEPCWRMLSFAYGQATLLMMECDSDVADADAFILSQNGVRQGDPMSSLLFSLAMHTVYSRLAERLQAGCYAFIDDSHGVGHLSECWTVWTDLPELLAPLGLQLNAAKCELTCFHTAALQHAADRDALAAFMSAGVKVNERCLRLLGCVVGATDSNVADELCMHKKFSADQRAAFQRLPLLRKQSGMTALQQLSGTVLTNRLRAMTPASTAAHAAEYDGHVLRAAHRLVGVRAVHEDMYDTQLRWPLRVGGFGLTSAVEIAPAAYIAGLACTLPSSPAFAALWSRGDELDPTWPLHSAVADSIQRITAIEQALCAQCPVNLVEKVSASVVPTSADTFVHDIRAIISTSCLIQSAVAHRITTLSHIARVTQAERRGTSGIAELARLRSLTEKESSRWLRVLPTDNHLQLTDIKWQWAAQLRLGMPVPVYDVSDGSTVCIHTTAANEDGWHALTCITRSPRTITDRHNAVVRCLAHAARTLNITPRIEPAGLAANDESRPDIQLDLPDVTLLGDVTISHPAAKTWRRV